MKAAVGFLIAVGVVLLAIASVYAFVYLLFEGLAL